jgi:hypothetical protein
MSSYGNKLTGAVLMLAGIMGFIFIADDLRHTGELIGVSAVLVSGILLYLCDVKRLKRFRLYLKWISYGLLAGLLVGGIIDNMILGESAGIILGFMVASVQVKIRNKKSAGMSLKD